MSIVSGKMKLLTLSMIVGTSMLVTACGERKLTTQAQESPPAVQIQSPEATQSAPASEEQPAKTMIASIPEHEIYLYREGIEGSSSGVTLQVGDRSQHFDWLFRNTPDLEVQDYDGDGKDELSIVMFVNWGTGVGIDDLHIIELSEATLEDHVFDHSFDEVSRKVSFSIDSKPDQGVVSGTFKIASDVYPIEIPFYNEKEQGKLTEQLNFHDVISFDTEGGHLKAKFGVGLTYENRGSSDYIGNVIADVTYQDGTFTLSNYILSLNYVLASIPEKEIYLSSDGVVSSNGVGGVALQVGRRYQHFDWTYRDLPELEVHDFDGDGKDELSIVLKNDKGTEERHIIELNEATLEEHKY
jgi:hypothetical protein